MTAKQFKETIKKLGLSLGNAGAVLDISTPTMYRYGEGKMAIPKKVALALEALITRKLKNQNLFS